MARMVEEKPPEEPILESRLLRSLGNARRTLRLNYPVVFLVVFFGMLLLPLQGYAGDFASFSTRFWGYEELVRSSTFVRLSVFKDQIFGETLVRSNHWLVYTGESSLDDYQNARPFTEEELARIQQKLDGLAARLREKGIRFMVVIVPGKNIIYPEMMPPQIRVLNEQSRTDQLVAYQREHGKAAILDLRPVLQEARKEHPVYYATDTHWNPYGIYAGYRAILAALQPDFPALQPHALEDFRYVSRGAGSGDLGIEWTQGLATEEMFQLEPRFERKVTQIPLTQGLALIPGRMIATYNPDPSLPRALVYHDSFFNDMIPFLADHFQWAVFHWAFQVNESFAAGDRPDIVIFEVTDRYLFRLLDITRK